MPFAETRSLKTIPPVYEQLEPRLDALLALHRADTELAVSLEKRIASLVERHATQVCIIRLLQMGFIDI